MCTKIILYVALAYLGFGILPLSTAAQDEPRERSAEVVCAEADDSLRARVQGERYHYAITTLMTCPVAGPRAFAVEWASPPRDTVALRVLAEVSANLRDQRVYDAAKAALRNTGTDRSARLAALQVLVGHFQRCLALVYRSPSREDIGGRAYVMLGDFANDPSHEGAQPLAASVRTDVVTTLREIGATDSDDRVKQIAAYLAERLAGMKEPAPNRCSSRGL